MRILRMMQKNRVVMAFACALMLVTLTTGCGKEKEEPILVDLSSESRQNEEENMIQNTEEDAAEDLPDEDVSAEELVCNVKSIGQDSFAAVKCTTYSDGDKDIMTSPAPGYEEADDLVTVYVNVNCTYQYKTIRNGGVNPEDVSSREGSFADLKDGMICNVKGSWRDGAFYADSIVMEEFS